jgi:hypothetical protein
MHRGARRRRRGPRGRPLWTLLPFALLAVAALLLREHQRRPGTPAVRRSPAAHPAPHAHAPAAPRGQDAAPRPGLRVWAAFAFGALAVAALVLRLHQRQPGLLYPDGYQYLLMARGIAGHLQPTVQLGHGGELFVPSVDAALKPLFPALVAAFSWMAGARAAADALTALAASATVVLAALLAGRLTGSRAGAGLAALAALSSPALGYWSGFAGPDPLAEALALATALALCHRRATTAGVLGALCAASRPEWAIVLCAAGLAGLARTPTRARAGRALLSGAFTLAAVLLLLRPPLAMPTGGAGALLGALAAGTALQLLVPWIAATPRRATLAAATTMLAFALAALAGHAPALAALARAEWPLFLLAGWGALSACATGRGRPLAHLLAALALLGAIYGYRNPGSARYFADLLPLLSVAAGYAAVGFPARATRRVRRSLPALALALAALTAIVAPAPPRLASDTFATLAARLAQAPPGTLVSEAPDAYGFLLPGRPQVGLRPGAHGLILLDGAQRAYDPGLTARGVVVARLPVPGGFERPDGRLDVGDAVLVRGVVTKAGPDAQPW